MPDPKDTSSQKTVPQDLPMPRYDYQKPATGSYSLKYDEKKPAADGPGREKPPALQYSVAKSRV